MNGMNKDIYRHLLVVLVSSLEYNFIYLKLQSVTFTSLSPSMFENLELQFLAEL